MKTHFDFNLLWFRFRFSLTLFAILVSGFSSVFVSGDGGDAAAMLALRDSLDPPTSLGWSGPDPCEWAHVGCSGGRVTRIQIGHQSLAGTLPETLRDLAGLERLELQFNSISGPIPSLAGMTSLQVLMLSHNNLTSVPKDLFAGMTSLRSVEVDENPLSPWELPETLRDAAASLQNLSANAAGLAGGLPELISGEVFPALTNLHLAFNNLSGGLPRGFSGLQIRSLWLNGQDLSGDIAVIGNMTSLEEVWLHSNSFSGSLPDFSGLKDLEVLSLRDNQFTGPVPASLVNLESLRVVNLTNNLLQGPVPEFKPSVDLDNELSGQSNRFCLSKPGKCDSQVSTLLLIAESMGYPMKFAENWRGNDACADWIGIACRDGNVTVINFEKMGLNGTISPEFASLKSLQRVILAGNNLTGTVPGELAALPLLTVLDVSNNRLHGKIPEFGRNSGVSVKTDGNPDMGKGESSSSSQGSGIGPSSGSGGGSGGGHGRKKNIALAVIIGVSVVVGIVAVSTLGFLAFSAYKKRKHFSRVQSPNAAMVIHPRDSGSDNDTVKITVAGSSVSVGPAAITGVADMAGGSDNNIQMVESGNLVISIQVLRSVTDNFSEDNILGRGGFGTVYKGELHDGTMIAVKRMESGVIAGKGLSEFKSEIAVLTKVRHRHLVALLGYCLDGNEKLLVYEYMPRGTLSSHIFNWAVEGLKPLEWTRRLTIALDVARGVEYLHSLAHQSFIHRDLKPSNILLGDDMRAKVADFGLVRLAPEGKGSVETRIAGTFGYLAPEYAVTGRVTTKVDIFSFGVILMELITGRKALDERQPEESMHLVTWFKRMHINPDSFRKAIDPSLDLSDEDTLASISTVAELAGHCCAREPYQRPDMGHAVNVLSSLVELWKPSDDQCPEDMYGIDLEMSLPQALKKWQAYEGRSNMESSSSSLLPSLDNTQTSIPTRPYGFAETFSSSDGR